MRGNRFGGARRAAPFRPHDVASLFTISKSENKNEVVYAIHLDAHFGEALRLGADVPDEVDANVAAFARWLVETVFANDAAAALDDRTKKHDLAGARAPRSWADAQGESEGALRRATPRRIRQALLPLREHRRLRNAAEHVAKFNLTQTMTREYVGELLSETGDAPKVRLTAPVLMSRMKKMQEALGGAAVLKKVRALQTDLDASQRHALAGEIDKVRDVLSAIAREVRGR